MKYQLLDDKLEEILVRHGILKKISLQDIADKIKEEVQKISQRSIVGLYGTGIDADALFLFFRENGIPIKIDYCFDRTAILYSFKNLIKREDVLKIEELSKMSVDYMIIGSYAFRDELKATLKKMNYQGMVLDFFELLQDYLEEYTTDYKSIYDTRILYESAKNASECKLYLEQLIKKYLLIRDFESAFCYIDRYIEQHFDEEDNYRSLKEELQELLNNIQKKIAARTTRDIIVYWMDAISYEHLEMFPYIAEESKKGITFENAYTVNPWTTETMKCMMYGQYSIEDRLFLKNNFEWGNTSLLDLLAEKGYRFAYVGMNKYVKMFPEGTICIPELNFSKENSSIPRYWNMLQLLYEQEEPLCIMVHTLKETHEPYICGELEKYKHFDCAEKNWSDEECKRQAAISSKYIDDRRHFYDSMLNRSSVRIIMSDHGRITNSIVRECRIHIIFTIHDENQAPRKVNELFSMIDFRKILKMSIEGKYDFKKIHRDYVITEAFDFYDGTTIKMSLNNPEHDKAEAYQRRGVITPKDRYCRFATGEERYFVGKNDTTDCSKREEYQDRIAELRKICGDCFIDISQYKKFELSKKLYETCDNK